MVTRINTTEWNKIRSEIYLRDKGICWVCNLFVTLDLYHLSHLIDRCRDGNDNYDNLVVMHKRCNYGKPAHYTIEECLGWKGAQATYILKTKRFHDPAFHRRTYEVSPKQQHIISEITPLTLTWIQGKNRWLFPPLEDGTYSKSNGMSVDKYMPIEGSKIIINQSSTAFSTTEVLNDKENKFTNATIDLGIFIVEIHRDDCGKLIMHFTHDLNKANIIGVNRYSNKRLSRLNLPIGEQRFAPHFPQKSADHKI